MPCIDREIDDYRIFIPAVMPLAAPSAGWWPPVTATDLPGTTVSHAATQTTLWVRREALPSDDSECLPSQAPPGLTPVPTGHATPVPPMPQ